MADRSAAKSRKKVTENSDFSKEFIFQAARSGGPGGQNVNKVSSKIELRWHVASSALLSDEEKQQVLEKLASRINKEGFLLLTCQAERSQLQNKEACIRKFYDLLEQVFAPVKERKPTKISRSALMKRKAAKKHLSNKKSSRSQRDFDE